MNILDLPNVMLIEIFEFLPYEETSKKRLVCRRIDQICQHVLNCGFNRVVRQHGISFKRIKALLPRRESERRNHCLARHADILTSIETRISMLSMTYSKYMDLNLCCFIPGRVLDEINRILRLIAKTTKPLRPHEVLQELRDISSMAIEHFDEKIANTLKKSYVECSAAASGSGGKSSGNNSDKSRLSLTATTANCLALGLGLGSSSSSTSASSSLSSSCWNSTIASTLQSQSLPLGGVSSGTFASNSRCCDSIRQRVNTLLSLGQTLRNIKSTSEPLQTTNAAEDVDMAEEPASGSSEHRNCPAARATMSYFRKLELEYKKGIVKMHRMQQVQTHQSRRLQQAHTSIAELNMQVIELKKRLEDVDAKNREISANIKQINYGEPAAIAPSPETTDITAAPQSPLKKRFGARDKDAKIHELTATNAGEPLTGLELMPPPLAELVVSPDESPELSSALKMSSKRQHENSNRTNSATASSSSSASIIQLTEEEESIVVSTAKRSKF